MFSFPNGQQARPSPPRRSPRLPKVQFPPADQNPSKPLLPRGSVGRSAMASPALGSQVRTATPRARDAGPSFAACSLITFRSLSFRAGGHRSPGVRRFGLFRQGHRAQGA